MCVSPVALSARRRGRQRLGRGGARDRDGIGLRLGVSQIAEQGAFMGMTAAGAFETPADAAISTMALSGSAALSENLKLFGGLEYGLARAGATGGYVAGVEGATFSGFQLGVAASEIMQAGDTLTMTVSQPLRVETGTMSFDLPVGRLADGTIVYDRVTGGLAPSGRQIDLGMAYSFVPNPLGEIELGFVYSLDAGHVAGREAAALAAAYKQAF